MSKSGEKYISNIKTAKKSYRIGRIILIDYEKDAAIADAEIDWLSFCPADHDE